MPFDPSTLTHDRPWRFVDRREAGDDITREDLDIALNDLADGISASTAASVVYVGSWNPASLAFPALRPDGTAVQARDAFVASGTGTVGGVSFVAGDTLVALVSRPGQSYASRWLKVPTVTVPAMLDIREAAENFAQAAQGDTVALVESTAAGILAVADGETFAVAADSTLSLYRRDGASATLLMADYQPAVAPVARQAPAAPALVTAMSALKSTGVPMKMILGSNYSSGNDAAATLNGLTAEIAEAGLTIADPDGTTVRLNSTLFLRDNLSVDIGNATTFLRGFSTAFALITHGGTVTEDSRVSGVRWRGGTFRPLDGSTGAGSFFNCGLDNSVFENFRILDFRGGIAWRLWGDRNRIRNFRVASETMATGTGGIRILGGDDNMVSNGFVQSGDDGLQFCPPSDDPLHGLYNMSSTNSCFMDINVHSASKAIIAAVVDPYTGNTGSDARIKDCAFIGITGSYGTKAIYIGNDAGDSAMDGQVDGISLHGIKLHKRDGSSIGVSGNALHIYGAWTGAVRNVTMSGVVVDGSTFDGTEIGMTVNAPGAIVRGDGVVVRGRYRGMRVSAGPADITISGDVEAATEGLSTDGSARHVIAVETTAAGTKLRIGDGSRIIGVSSPTIDGVVTPMSGVWVGQDSVVELGDVQILKRTGATGTNALNIGIGSGVAFDSITTDCDNFSTGSGNLHRNTDALGRPASVTIAGGVIAMPATTIITLDTEGGAATDDLDMIEPIAGIMPGQVIALRTANNGRDVVIKHGTGNIKTSSGTDITLNTTTSRALFVWDGINWTQIGTAQGSSTATVPAGTLSITASTNASYSAAQLADVVYVDGPLTRTPTWTMATTGAVSGMRVLWVMRDTTQYSAVISKVSGTITLATLTAPGDWAEVIYDGSAWQLVARSALGGGTGVTVASLPAANTVGAGARSFVTDANSTTFQSIVAGGGANALPVYSDGTNWRIG